jgi:hypothetical protein
MKKYLLTGLTILIGANLVVLGGVAHNRSSEATSHLILTERELTLPYNSGMQKENSGISLSINWRTSSIGEKDYSFYNSNSLKLSKDELSTLGFEEIDKQKNHWSQPLELYWAFEFDGALHHTEIEKAAAKYQEALLAFEGQENEESKHKEKQSRDNLAREKTSNSRLFFIEASANYDLLATKFSGQKNILIVKGLTKYSYNTNSKNYSLHLNNLSVANIMVPLEYTGIFSGLSYATSQDIQPPRYTVSIKWGARLEPWVIGTKRLKE